jgi:hypothetical protein
MVHEARQVKVRVGDARGRLNVLRGRPSFENLPTPYAIRLAYEILLDRQPDQTGVDSFSRELAASMSRRDMVDTIMGSDEFALHSRRVLPPSLHFSRGVFVRSLPPARRILDLGGSSRYNSAGALVSFGYPYPFEELVIVELPADERHEH